MSLMQLEFGQALLANSIWFNPFCVADGWGLGMTEEESGL